MVWHYNAFLSYHVKPVEEERVWLDADTANMTQVDVNNFFLRNGMLIENENMEQLKINYESQIAELKSNFSKDELIIKSKKL